MHYTYTWKIYTLRRKSYLEQQDKKVPSPTGFSVLKLRDQMTIQCLSKIKICKFHIMLFNPFTNKIFKAAKIMFWSVFKNHWVVFISEQLGISDYSNSQALRGHFKSSSISQKLLSEKANKNSIEMKSHSLI